MISEGYFYNPDIRPNCKEGEYGINPYNNKEKINIYYCRCNNLKSMKKVNLRYYSIFKINKDIPVSVLLKIINLFIFESYNAKRITEKLIIEYNNNINNKTIEKILFNIRKIIYIYMEDKYNNTLIGGLNPLNYPINVAIDETLLLHSSTNEQIWIIGGIETKTRKVRLILAKDRTRNTIESFVNNNFQEGTHFIHDDWPSYNFLDNNMNFTHEIHRLGGGDFGFGRHSTSHIENYWSQYKKLLTRIYGMVPKKNYTLFFREIKFRINLGYKTHNEAKDIIKNIFKKIYSLNNFIINEIEDL